METFPRKILHGISIKDFPWKAVFHGFHQVQIWNLYSARWPLFYDTCVRDTETATNETCRCNPKDGASRHKLQVTYATHHRQQIAPGWHRLFSREQAVPR